MTDLGAQVDPLPPPFPAEKLWQAWTTLRAMLNAGGMKALYDDAGQARAAKARNHLGDRTGPRSDRAGGL